MDKEEINRRLCEEAVKCYRLRDRIIDNDDAESLRSFATGQMDGLRIALCVVNGWDVHEESDKEGLADELIVAHWQRVYPEEWTGMGL